MSRWCASAFVWVYRSRIRPSRPRITRFSASGRSSVVSQKSIECRARSAGSPASGASKAMSVASFLPSICIAPSG